MIDIKGRYEAFVQQYEQTVNEYGEDAEKRIADSNEGWGLADILMRNMPYFGHHDFKKTIANEIDNERMTVSERNEAKKLNDKEDNEAVKKMRGMYYRNVNRVQDAAKARVESDFPSNSVLFSLSKTARDKIFSDAWDKAYDNEHSSGIYDVMYAYSDSLYSIENILGIAKKDWNK